MATSIGNLPHATNPPEFIFMTVYWLTGVYVSAILIGQVLVIDLTIQMLSVYCQDLQAKLKKKLLKICNRANLHKHKSKTKHIRVMF